MKKPTVLKLSCQNKSASEEQLQRGKLSVGAHGFKSREKVKNLKCFKPRLANHKSESSVIPHEMQELKTAESQTQFLPMPKTPKQPNETLRRSLSKLKSSQWDEYVVALRDIVQISRFNPQLLEKSMPIIYKGVTKLLKSLRISAARTACQAANELFMNIQHGQAQEFDELVHALLQKSGDSGKSLQKDAMEALNSMIIHMPPTQSIKALLHRRIAGFSLNVRITASKLLACVLDDSDERSPTSLNEETKERLLSAALRFLQDDCNDIKYCGKRLLTTLLQHKDFEHILQRSTTGNAHQKG